MVATTSGGRSDVVPGELPKGSPTRRLPDIAKMQALGFEPKVTLDEGSPERSSGTRDQTGRGMSAALVEKCGLCGGDEP